MFFLFIFLFGIAVFAQNSSNDKTEDNPPIEDNSFLIEEAYNQEPGVVQHINAFTRFRNGDYVYTFTEELPIVSQKHQFSFTIPVVKAADFRAGLGDLTLNYRYQLINNKKTAVAPRFSLLLPTGNAGQERGKGGVGFQFNLPVSVRLSRSFVTHTNAGFTFTPRAKNVLGERARTIDYNLGQSLVWLAVRRFNVLVETVWNNTKEVIARRRTMRENEVLINPGVRWSHNFRNGLQIVPGVAVPFGVGPSYGERGIFLYLSFEHPFKKQEN